MYTCHLSVLRRSLVEEVGGFDPDFEGSQDWDLVLKVTERARAVIHVPQVLYHWRIEGSTSAAGGGGEAAKPWAFEAGTRAIAGALRADRLARDGSRGTRATPASTTSPGADRRPLVSIVIPTNGQRREIRYQEVVLVEHCVRSIVEQLDLRELRDVVVVDQSTPSRGWSSELEAIAGDRLRVVPSTAPSTSRRRSTSAPSTATASTCCCSTTTSRWPRRTGSSGW